MGQRDDEARLHAVCSCLDVVCACFESVDDRVQPLKYLFVFRRRHVGAIATIRGMTKGEKVDMKPATSLAGHGAQCEYRLADGGGDEETGGPFYLIV